MPRIQSHPTAPILVCFPNNIPGIPNPGQGDGAISWRGAGHSPAECSFSTHCSQGSLQPHPSHSPMEEFACFLPKLARAAQPTSSERPRQGHLVSCSLHFWLDCVQLFVAGVCIFTFLFLYWGSQRSLGKTQEVSSVGDQPRARGRRPYLCPDLSLAHGLPDPGSHPLNMSPRTWLGLGKQKGDRNVARQVPSSSPALLSREQCSCWPRLPFSLQQPGWARQGRASGAPAHLPSGSFLASVTQSLASCGKAAERP